MRLKKFEAKKVRGLKRKVAGSLMRSTSFRSLVRCKRAISPVLSNLILIAVVIVLGFTALAYARSISNDYTSDYHASVSSDIDALKETVAFENVVYNSTSSTVQIYVINAGRINVTIDIVYLSTNTTDLPYTMKYLNGTSAPDHILSVGNERQIVVQNALTSGAYNVKIITTRGSSFAYGFAV